MKVILCTGDSHTCGQGSDDIKTIDKPKDPNRRYDTAGKGIGKTNLDFEIPSYVNLLRQYVTQNTDSSYLVEYWDTLAAKYGGTVEDEYCLMDREWTISNTWDMMYVCVGEQRETAELAIYLDGKLDRVETLYAEITRYDDWSLRELPVQCKGAKEVKLVSVSGKVYIRQIHYAAGEYVVLNSAVGACSTKRYLEECFTYAVEDMHPDIVVAEAQTINDWIQYKTAQEHYDTLVALIGRCRQLGAKVLFSTVAPIESVQENAAGVPYKDFIDASLRAAADTGVILVDSYQRFKDALAPIPQEEQYDYMYVDRWHVRAKGHKLYADAIWESLKELL